MKLFGMSFVISILFCTIILYFSKKSLKFSFDLYEGPQRFHSLDTPRIGGLGIYISYMLMAFYLYYSFSDIIYLKIFFSSIPIFIGGFLEDTTKKISPTFRFLTALLSATVFVLWGGFYIQNVEIGFINFFLQYKIISIFFSIFAIVGVANSINIIDGFNGLAAGVSLLILISISYVALDVNDYFVFTNSLIFLGFVVGFMFLNYPFGKLFLGDCGAYLLGFMISALSIILVSKNQAVSPWYPFLTAYYPILETLFSIYRRKFIHKRKISEPDSNHLHQLFYKRVVPVVFNFKKDYILLRNSLTSPFMWFLSSMAILPSVIFYKDTFILIIFTIFFTFIYVLIYKSIVTFRLGKFLRKIF